MQMLSTKKPGYMLSALLLVGSGCGDDAPASSDDDGTATGSSATTDLPDPTSTTTDPSTSDGMATAPASSSSSGDRSDSSSGGDSSSGRGGAPKPALGQTPNPICEASVAALNVIIAENASGTADPMVVEEAYLGIDGDGSVLQAFVQEAGGLLGRVDAGSLVDDTAILAALTDGSPEALVDVETQIYVLLSLLYRFRIAKVADALPDMNRPPALLYAEWDDAYCYFDGVLRAHAQAADALGVDFTEGGIRTTEDDIQFAFEWGHENIEGPDAAWAVDEWNVPAAKQIVEKSLFRVYDRLLVEYATQARDNDDALTARRALGILGVLEDRFLDRNTPGIDVVRAELERNDPTTIEVAEIERQLDITWIKRTRRYTDGPIVDDTVGTPTGFTGANEGRTYAKIALPRMADTLAGFDPAAHLADWDALIEGVAADDPDGVNVAATALTDDNCAYHTALGLPDCTTADVE